jgi:hypothetical protein
MAALNEVREPLAVVALLEKEMALSQNVHRLARNRLAAVTTWEGDKEAAISRIARTGRSRPGVTIDCDRPLRLIATTGSGGSRPACGRR